MPRLSFVGRFVLALVILCSQAGLLSSGERLAQGISDVTAAPEFKHAHWGILVVDLKTGESLDELNADRLFAPASVTKLYSVAHALDALGADHRFVTPVFARGEVSPEGTLAGDLILVASGDLTLGGRTTPEGQVAFTNNDHTYANGSEKGELTAPDPLAGLIELARQVAAVGIRHVAGDVLIDDRLFDRETGSGSGPRRVTPIVVNDNLIDFTITPTAAGQSATVDWRPRSALIQVDARIDTAAPGTPVSTSIDSPDGWRIVLRGSIPEGRKPLVRVHEVPDPAAFARGLLIEALNRAGVTSAASPLAPPAASATLPPRDQVAPLREVARFTSPPFAEHARLILKVSHNLHASTLPLLVAAGRGERTLSAGLRRQHDFLESLGVEVNSISFGGGAGGAAADFVTPRATVQLLRGMHARADAEVYKNALPLLGVDGTLAEAVEGGCPARGKVAAKTGTLYWDNVMNGRTLLTSKALAGYCVTRTGRELAFAVFVNGVHLERPTDTAGVGKALGRIAEAIYDRE